MAKNQIDLSKFNIADLENLLNEKRAASVGPLLNRHAEVSKQLSEIENEIRAVNPKWSAPTLADKILEYVKGAKKGVSLSDIKSAVGSNLTYTAMKKLVETDKTLTKGADDKYTVTA